MTDSITHIVPAFLGGAISVALVAHVADRFGSKIAALLASFPGTLIVTLFLIGFRQGPETVRAVAANIPALMSSFAIFLTLYCGLLHRGIPLAVSCGLTAWFLTVWVHMRYSLPFAGSIALFVMTYAVCLWHMSFRQTFKSHPSDGVHPSLIITAVRFLMGGSVVTGAVLVTEFVGPNVGAVVAIFPGITITTLIATYVSGGASLSRAMAKNLFLASSANAAVYAASAAVFYPSFDIYLGTIASISSLLLLGGGLFFATRRLRS